MHKSGFVNIIGFPNVGKSTILNALLGEKLVIVNPKAQTTRQRIFGIYNDEETQIVFSDTPGYIRDPKYMLQESMNTSVNDTFKDSDVIMYITEPEIRELGYLGEKLKSIKKPLIIVINKADLSNVEKLNDFAEFLDKEFSPVRIITTSALHKFNVDKIIPIIKEFLPEHPPYFDKEELSDRNVRFFISEIIRENILTYYSKEIPYSSEVIVEEYKEAEKITRIKATIYVERESQKMIMLGKEGRAIKKLGTQSRLAIEKFIQQKVFLDLTVKVLKNWRSDTEILKKMGYIKS